MKSPTLASRLLGLGLRGLCTLLLIGALALALSTPPTEAVAECEPGGTEPTSTEPSAAPASLEESSAADAAVPIYRLYNPFTQEHLYTPAADERRNLAAAGWTDEGVAWSAPQWGMAVYRLYHPALDDHLYTTDAREIAVLTETAGWVRDFGGAAVFQSAGFVNVYRLYNPSDGRHLLTRDEGEYAALAAAGWTPEGAKLFGAEAGAVRTPEDEVRDRILALQAEYPEGTRWTNDDYYESRGGWSQMGTWWAGWGCHAWALKCSDAAFGDAPGRLHYDRSLIRVGDLLRLDGRHTAVVLALDGDIATLSDGNWGVDENRYIHWGRQIKLSESTIDFIITRWD